MKNGCKAEDNEKEERQPGSTTLTHSHTRRAFLKTVTVASAGAMLLEGGGEARTSPQGRPAIQGRIDVHNHMLPSFYKSIRKSEPTGVGSSHSSAMRNWTPALAVEAMDENRIALAMTSLAVGGVSFQGSGARTLARESNEYGARMASDHPGRFGLFAALPLPDQEGSLLELTYAFDVLKADGIALLTDYGDKWTGDPAYAPTFEELNRRNAVVFVHPTVPNCCRTMVPGVPASLTEYLFDTTRAITSFLINRTFTRFPNVRFIFCHSGGTISVLANRISAAFSNQLSSSMPGGVIGELRKQHYDVANASNPAPLAALTDLVPSSQLLFGSDFPFIPIDRTTGPLDHADFSADEMKAINRGNAERLFPRLKNI